MKAFMRSKSVFAPLFLISLSSSLALATDPNFNDRTKLPPINVSYAIQKALKAPQGQITGLKVDLAKEAVSSARSDFLPTASVSTNISQIENPLTLGRGDALTGLHSGSLNESLFSLPSFFMFKAAQGRLRAASSAAAGDQLRIAGAKTSSYFDVLKMRIILDIAKENTAYIRDLIDSLKANGASADDITLVEGVLGSAVNDKHISIQQEEIAENNLNQNTFINSADFFLMEPEPLNIPKDENEAVEAALHSNPDLMAANENVTVNSQNVRAAKSAYAPTVTGSVTAYDFERRKSQDFNQYHLSGASAGVTASISVYDSKRSANVQSQKINKQIAEFQKQNQVMAIKTSIKSSYAQIHERQIRIQSLCQAVRMGVDTVNTMRAKLKNPVTVQDLLLQKSSLVKNAAALNNEFLSDVMDTYVVSIQMGTLNQSLPEPLEPVAPSQPNPQVESGEIYNRLLNRCSNYLK